MKETKQRKQNMNALMHFAVSFMYKCTQHNRVFPQPAPCLAPCLVNFSLYKYGAIRSSAPFHLVNLTRSYTELTRSRPQIAPCLAPYGSVFSSVLGKSDKIFKIWKKSKRLKSALNTQLSMKE